MARLPYAGGRNGMGTTAVDNDFLNQLEEAYGAGDEMIAATLAGEPTPIRELPAMLVQSSRQEMREGSVQPPQQTVREELAMSALESGLGSRPRSFVPPTSRMSKGGQTPRYNQNSLVYGDSGNMSFDPRFVSTAGTTQNPLEEEELGYPQQIWNYAKEHPYQTAAEVAALGMFFAPEPLTTATGAARLGTSAGGRLLMGGGKALVKPVKRVLSKLGDRGGKIASRFRGARDARGQSVLAKSKGDAALRSNPNLGYDQLVSRLGNQSLAHSAAGYGLPAAAVGSRMFGDSDNTSQVSVGVPEDAPNMPDGSPAPDVSSGPPFRTLDPRTSSGYGMSVVPVAGLGSEEAEIVPALAEAQSRVRNVLAERRAALSGSTNNAPQAVVNSQIIDTAADLQGGETDLISKQREYLNSLLDPERQASAKRLSTGATLAAMAGALLTPEASGGGMGAAFKAAAEGGMAAQKSRREDEAITAQAGLAMMRDLTTRDMQAKGAEDALTLEAARAEDTLALEDRRFANTKENQLYADEFSFALEEMLAGERAGIEASRLAGSFPDLQRAKTAMEIAKRNGDMEEYLLYYKVAVLQIEEDEALIDIALKLEGITDDNIDQVTTGEIQDILNKKNKDGVSYIDQIRLDYSPTRPNSGSFGGQRPSINP